jgi:hypothetical protein
MENPIIDTIMALAAVITPRERVALALTLIDVEAQCASLPGFVEQEDRIDNACAFLQAVRVPKDANPVQVTV